jgi:hypothetical protein
MGWLSRLFKKEKKMDLKEKTLPEIREELSKVDFQWIKGDKAGNVEKFDDVLSDESTGMTFVSFKGGGRINIELLGEYLDTFPASKVDFNSVAVDNPPITNVLSEATGQDKKSAAPVRRNTVSSIELEESPIYKLLKQQKENWVSVNISLKLNLPPKNLYNVLITSFDGANEEIVDYVTEGIDIEDIRAALAESILAYYNVTQKSTSQRSKKNIEENKSVEDGEE